jgi:alpha-L-rhamnosidase
MAGVPRITLHEKAGTKIIIRYAEVLYPDLPEYAGKEGTMMLENYRDATSTDVYICRGGEEVFQPKFTFHGYRYIEISGVEHAPELEEVESLQYSSVTEFHGSLTSSHKLLNRFAENVSWSQKCNFINIPTDCPQRNERMGWAGDTHIFCHTALNNSSLKKFYERNLQAMCDLQTPEGQYPEIAPVGGGFGGITYECASIFMAWELYEQYGDIRTLEKFYPGMQKYMDYMKDKGLPGTKVNPAIGPLGDWLAPEETDLLLLWNAFYYKEADLMSRIAGALGRTEEQHQYEALAAKVKKFWNETFVLPDSGKTCNADGTLCDTQCSYAIALSYGVAEDRKRIGEHLIRKTRAIGHTVGTGFFGTGILNQMLTEQGAVEDAWKMMLQTAFPSWLYPVTQGATTIWEHWDSYTKEKGFGGQNAMNSFNHYSLGSVLSWLYHTGLGIQRDETKPGYQHILLKPQPGPLEFMKGSVDSPYGVISAGWERKGDKIEYQVTIPVNTTATLFKNTQDPADTVELGSGTYTFML